MRFFWSFCIQSVSLSINSHPLYRNLFFRFYFIWHIFSSEYGSTTYSTIFIYLRIKSNMFLINTLLNRYIVMQITLPFFTIIFALFIHFNILTFIPSFKTLDTKLTTVIVCNTGYQMFKTLHITFIYLKKPCICRSIEKIWLYYEIS